MISIRFYGQLNDFLKIGEAKKENGKGEFVSFESHKLIEMGTTKGLKDRRTEGTSFDTPVINREFSVNQSVKDLIESQGVPHTEVDLILVYGVSVGFTYIVKDEDYISVYPEFNTIDISPLVKLKPELPEQIKFILDVHLGKLAKYLRLFGFDSIYENNQKDKELIEASVNGKRILLTRDVGLLKNGKLIYGYWLRNTDPIKQIAEITVGFKLQSKFKPFSRCLSCNGEIKSIRKEEIISKLEPKTNQYYNEFFICTNCGKIYWKGSHWKKMEQFIILLENQN